MTNCLKMQASEINYNCRLRGDSVHSNGRVKTDSDVGLLVACKVQLSSEVIKWKTESLRLQKECDSANHRSKELDQTVSKLLNETKDLKTQLLNAEDENKRLKTKNSISNDERINNIQRLTQSLNKYHSFPTVDNTFCPSASKLFQDEVSDLQKQEVHEQDWKEVSVQMLMQMQQEMKELENMNSYIAACHLKKDMENVQSNSDCREELELEMSKLISDARELKHKLLDQRKKLKLLLKNSSKDNINVKDSFFTRRNLSSSIVNNSTETYQDNFTTQLEDLSNLHLMKDVDVYNAEEDITIHPCECATEMTPETVIKKESTQTIEDRICPICQELFDTTIPQADFEEHVFNHLEAESASVLEQYVIL